MNGLTQTLWVWLLLLSTMFPRFIYAPACYQYSFFFETESHSVTQVGSAVAAQPQLTAASASWAQLILPPQPPE